MLMNDKNLMLPNCETHQDAIKANSFYRNQSQQAQRNTYHPKDHPAVKYSSGENK